MAVDDYAEELSRVADYYGWKLLFEGKQGKVTLERNGYPHPAITKPKCEQVLDDVRLEFVGDAAVAQTEYDTIVAEAQAKLDAANDALVLYDQVVAGTAPPAAAPKLKVDP